MDNNYYNYRYTSCRTYSADARGKSADGSVNWYTAGHDMGGSGRICVYVISKCLNDGAP